MWTTISFSETWQFIHSNTSHIGNVRSKNSCVLPVYIRRRIFHACSSCTPLSDTSVSMNFPFGVARFDAFYIQRRFIAFSIRPFYVRTCGWNVFIKMSDIWWWNTWIDYCNTLEMIVDNLAIHKFQMNIMNISGSTGVAFIQSNLNLTWGWTDIPDFNSLVERMDKLYRKRISTASTLVQASSTFELEGRATKNDFMYPFQPIYYTLRLFGMMPFTIIFDSNGGAQKPIVRAVDVAWFVILFCLYLLTVFMSIQMRSPGSSILYTVYLFGSVFVVLELIGCALVALLSMYNRSKLVNILKMFQKFDKKVSFWSIGDDMFCPTFRKTILILYSWSALKFGLIMKGNINMPGCIAHQYLRWF